MVKSVGAAVDMARALQPNEITLPVRINPFQLVFVAEILTASRSDMIADQAWIFVVGLPKVQRTVHPLIAGPLLAMLTLAVNPPGQVTKV